MDLIFTNYCGIVILVHLRFLIIDDLKYVYLYLEN